MAAIGLIYLIAYYVARTLIASELENDVGKDAVKGAWDGAASAACATGTSRCSSPACVVVVGTVLARGQLQHRDVRGLGRGADPALRSAAQAAAARRWASVRATSS